MSRRFFSLRVRCAEAARFVYLDLPDISIDRVLSFFSRNLP